MRIMGILMTEISGFYGILFSDRRGVLLLESFPVKFYFKVVDPNIYSFCDYLKDFNLWATFFR